MGVATAPIYPTAGAVTAMRLLKPTTVEDAASSVGRRQATPRNRLRVLAYAIGMRAGAGELPARDN
jgi:hypothetical protein